MRHVFCRIVTIPAGSSPPILSALNRLVKREDELFHQEDELLWNGEPAIRLHGAGMTIQRVSSSKADRMD